MLAPTRKGLEIKGIAATKAGPLLRNSITVHRAGDEHEKAPGFVEADLVAHCGPTLVGELIRLAAAKNQALISDPTLLK